MLEYIGNIIASCREDAGETDYSADNGIPQSVPLKAANDAQIHLQSIIYHACPWWFETDEDLDGVANQRLYTLTSNVYLGGSISLVEFSRDGQEKNFYELDQKTPRFRSKEQDNYPRLWIPHGQNSFFIDPYLSSSVGKFRATFSKAIDTLDLRRGQVSTVTLNGGATAIVSITLTNPDETALAANEYICVSSPGGAVQYQNIQYDYNTGYNSTTKVLTFTTPAPLADGSIAVLDYITCGRYTRTHSELTEDCRPVISAHVSRRFYLGKSSSDIEHENANIKAFGDQVRLNYERINRGAKKPRYKGKFEGI